MTRPVRVWRIPVVLGVLTAAGLAAGLVGDGAWDAAAVAALAVPVLAGAWLSLRPLWRRPGKRASQSRPQASSRT